MQNNIIALPQGETQLCAQCDAGSARRSWQYEQFPYGVGRDHVLLTARVPVWTCDSCAIQYSDGEAEVARHAAICQHLERLTPAEVRGIREQYHLSQQEWAERTGLGVASVKRWETGNLIQGEATDRYLRLLKNREIFSKLPLKGKQSTSLNTPHRFQTTLPDLATQCAAVFVLRKG